MPVRARLHRLRLRLHLAWLAVAPAGFAAMMLGGLAYFPLSAPVWDDPCCHVQAPGGLALIWGAGGLLFAMLHRKEFDRLMALGGKASFHAHEKRLEELARQLPQSYRDRLKERREEMRSRKERRGRPPGDAGMRA